MVDLITKSAVCLDQALWSCKGEESDAAKKDVKESKAVFFNASTALMVAGVALAIFGIIASSGALLGIGIILAGLCLAGRVIIDKSFEVPVTYNIGDKPNPWITCGKVMLLYETNLFE